MMTKSGSISVINLYINLATSKAVVDGKVDAFTEFEAYFQCAGRAVMPAANGTICLLFGAANISVKGLAAC
jgi:hypothetical protein